MRGRTVDAQNGGGFNQETACSGKPARDAEREMPVTVRELASDERGQGSARLLEGVVSRTWSCGRQRSVR